MFHPPKITSTDNLELTKTQVASLVKKGMSLHQQGNLEEAQVIYEQILNSEPDHFDALQLLGVLFAQIKKYSQSVKLLSNALKINPNHPGTYSNRGISLKELRFFDEALSSFDQAIAINPDYGDAHYNRGNTLMELKRFDEALSSFDQAIIVNPEHTQAYNNRGNTLKLLKRFDEALSSYDQAIAIRPDYPEAYNNRSNILKELKQFDKALANYNHAISIDPDYADAYFNKSTLLLLRGDYREGWQLYEWRWKQKHNINSLRSYKKPVWVGNESLTNKTLLIIIEQGFGDYIQFIRYALLAEQLGAKVILEVPLVLMKLTSTLKGHFIFVESGKLLPEFDYYCPVVSLPLAFKTSVETIPAALPYLYVDEAKKQQWNKRLVKQSRLRIGIVWAGNPDHKNDHNRSLLLKKFSSLLRLPFEFHSLQKDIREVDAQTIINFPHIYQHQDELHDFSDTAALIDAMDIIISVDTSVAHLAGAMGKKLWLLLPYLPDFRWMLDREDSPWYPSARLYRQEKINDWNSVLKNLEADLLKHVN